MEIYRADLYQSLASRKIIASDAIGIIIIPMIALERGQIHTKCQRSTLAGEVREVVILHPQSIVIYPFVVLLAAAGEMDGFGHGKSCGIWWHYRADGRDPTGLTDPAGCPGF